MTKLSSRSVLATLISLSLIVPAAAFAAEFRTGNAPTNPKDEVVLEDLYLLGGSVSSAGTVKGDLIASGGNILINGPVSGDIAAAGGNVSVLSDVGDDVRVVGGTLVIQGAVTGDVLAAGGQVTIESSKIGGDVEAGGGVVRLEAPVTGDVQIAGGDVRIESVINGNVDVRAETLTLGPKAHIHGTLTYKSPKTATLETGAVVTGETTYTKSPDVREAAKLGLVAFFSVWFVARMFMIFSGALVIGYVFQRFADELVLRATKRPLAEFGRGVVFVIVTPIVSVLLLFTVIGLAFGVLGLLGYAAMLILGAMMAPLIIGSVVHTFIFKQHAYEVNWKTILTGTILFFVVKAIPFVGPIAVGCVTLIGLGAALSIKGKIMSEWR